MLLRHTVDSHQIFSTREQICGVQVQEFRQISLLIVRSHSTYTILTVFLKGGTQVLFYGRSEPPGQLKI